MVDDWTDQQIQAEIMRLSAMAVAGQLDDLNAEFHDEPVSTTPVIEMITKLRTVFMLKHMLPKWYSYRDAARAELDRRGRDGAKVLRGLYL
jgi:hypothetical protein